MSLAAFIEPPTKETLEDARRALQATRDYVNRLTSKITAAEKTLAQIVRESQYAINQLQTERAALERHVSNTMAYLSPVRWLPLELLREIFLWTFEDHPCSAWVLAAVCTSWRRLALRIPVIWSKVSPLIILLCDQYAARLEPISVGVVAGSCGRVFLACMNVLFPEQKSPSFIHRSFVRFLSISLHLCAGKAHCCY